MVRHIQTKYIFDKIDYDSKYNDEIRRFSDGYKDWSHKYHHAGFDIVANRELEIIKEYVDGIEGNVSGDICYWVTGHSMGGAVANLIAANLISNNNEINGRKDNVYCYTFAAPNNYYIVLPDNKDIEDNDNDDDDEYIEEDDIEDFYNIDDLEPKTSKYRCIFNIVNDDDFVTKVPMEYSGWTKYGCTGSKSIEAFTKKIPDNYSLIYEKDKEYKLYLKRNYNGNKTLIDITIGCFNSIFLLSKDMREETYRFDLNPLHMVIRDLWDSSEEDNSKPYQKRVLNVQYQTPAYLMQSLAHAMHKYGEDGNRHVKWIPAMGDFNSNQIDFLMKKFAPLYNIPKLSMLITSGCIERAHSTEAYYALTKELEPVDFE